MTHGPSVKIPCVQDAPGAAAEFKFPAEWGGSLMQCREPLPCLADFPVPPYHSGLVVRRFPLVFKYIIHWKSDIKHPFVFFVTDLLNIQKVTLEMLIGALK